MQETNRMHGLHSYDVASFFPQVDRIELEFLALDHIISQMTYYIKMIGKEVDHRPKE